ncbi:lipoprotein localization protein LolB [Vibrio rotiferianus]|jgi:outer membrane lipoprotein LolB|uniref:Outer-membrane lipoprotein LolB n=1 Tax=Vibrio rotiferianus TaxID=190895 RepID=A0A510I339_9VIBR|nr:lipoprotein insertase outer membrane protein LolB [Vibrio rotiferianus]NOH50838.1 lipoprotein localization protein LolB [Vibrio rotiferianus]NOH69576.1 lipoprotein localization protein LolB [Vibrio rotiferianus]TMX30750.1 lipoprotein localization protein LolB [Vibrio rotiferianus]TMX45665.1 lipoprotein localization protein LolB [Vibrio rotiferianus]TMX58119.1 lipoprotein localization protein LolB [Vibrio rotiferianus]
MKLINKPSNMTLRSFLILFFSSIVLAGCSSVPDSITSVEWQAHEQRLKTINDFQATGKLGYIAPDQRQSLNFYWKQSTTLSQLRLTTVLGQTALKLTITPQGATVETYDDQVLTARNANQLIYRLTGLMMPVDHLPDWLLGLPTNADSFQLSSTNTLQVLDKQIGLNDWNIDYQRYGDIEWHNQTLPLPSKLKLSTSDVKINLVITKWNITQ